MEKVIAVGIQRQGETDGAVNASMEELEELVRTAGGEVVEIHTQKKDRPDPATFIGKGKVAELAERVILLKVRTLVFDDELKPVQQRNLEAKLGRKVIGIELNDGYIPLARVRTDVTMGLPLRGMTNDE